MELPKKDLREEMERTREKCLDILPSNLRRIREQSKYTIDWVAEQLSRAKVTIYQWENGNRAPSAKELLALSKLYNVGIEEFFKNPFGPDCTRCGAKLERKYRFCPECGAMMSYKE